MSYVNLTPNLRLSKVDPSDPSLDIPTLASAFNSLCDVLDRLAPIAGLCIHPRTYPASDLFVMATAGSFRKSDGTVGYYNNASLTLFPNCRNYVYLIESGALAVSVGAWPVATSYVPLAVVTTTDIVVSIIDTRLAGMCCTRH